MTRHLRLPPRGRSGAWLFALGIALALAVQPIWPDRTAVAVAAAIALTLVAAARWRLRWAPFPYGPVALLWYLPWFRDPAMIEFLVSIVLILYLGVRAAHGRPVGLAIFALAPPSFSRRWTARTTPAPSS